MCESCKRYREALTKLLNANKVFRSPDIHSESARDLMRDAEKVAQEALDSIPEPVEDCENCTRFYNDKPRCMGCTERVCEMWKPRAERKEP